MAGNGKCQLISAHSHAIIFDSQTLHTAAMQAYLYSAGTGINGIFNKFFQRTCRALNHLAGGNLIDQMFR